MYHKFIFILPLIFIPNAFAEYPYQNQCKKTEIERTKNLTQDPSITIAGFCERCDSSLNVILDMYTSIKTEIASIPRRCFLAMALRGSTLFSSNQYVYCENKEQANFDTNKKFCINEEYIKTIHKVWKDITECFEYDIERQNELFHLINQESGGILNIKSQTGARCLGQVTIDYVKTLNNIIRSAYKSNPLNHSEIYREVIQKCPQLKEKTLKNINFITCKTSMDPYTCLFYTFYGLERNHRKMKETLQSQLDYMGSREFPQSAIDKYQLPIKLNEMLIIKGTTVNGNQIEWVVWDDSELYNLWQKIDSSKELNIKKVPLFKKQEDIEKMFNYWAHNGGQSLVNKSLVKRIVNLKQNISNSCKENSKENRCLARDQIKQGSGIKSSLALEIFTADLLNTYPSKSKTRRKEVAEYVKKIQASNKKVFDFDKGSAQTNIMLNRYKNSNSDLDLKDIERFQQQITLTCPRLNFN